MLDTDLSCVNGVTLKKQETETELHNPIFIKRSLNIPAMINLINANYLRLLDANSHGQAIG